MNDQIDDTEDGPTSVRVVLYPPDGPEVAVRQIAFGMTPLVLLEAEYDEDEDEMTFVITASMLDDYAELLTLMDGYTEALRDALAQIAADAAGEGV